MPRWAREGACHTATGVLCQQRHTQTSGNTAGAAWRPVVGDRCICPASLRTPTPGAHPTLGSWLQSGDPGPLSSWCPCPGWCPRLDCFLGP